PQPPKRTTYEDRQCSETRDGRNPQPSVIFDVDNRSVAKRETAAIRSKTGATGTPGFSVAKRETAAIPSEAERPGAQAPHRLARAVARKHPDGSRARPELPLRPSRLRCAIPRLAPSQSPQITPSRGMRSTAKKLLLAILAFKAHESCENWERGGRDRGIA